MPIFKDVGRKISRRGPMEKPRLRNTPISLPLLYQWRVKRRNGHTPRAELKGTQHHEPCVKK